MKKTYSLFLVIYAIIFSHTGICQSAVNYNDVGVIVNIADDTSMSIGNYFMQKRNIPASNLIKINVTNAEVIDSTEWQSLRKQVQDTITTKGLNLNYLVTTKGMPLVVCYDYPSGCSNIFVPNSRNASVEDELMLILGPDSSWIGQSSYCCGAFAQPYYNQNAHFTNAKYGMYLVTRLDGYTPQDVYRLIDSSGPNIYVNKSQVKFVLDAVGPSSGYYDIPLNSDLTTAGVALSAAGWKDTLNATNGNYIYTQQNVMGYWSWGSNSGATGAGYNYSYYGPQNTWSRGAIGDMAVSTSARSFAPGTGYGQSLIADLIAEGISGASGYVEEPTTVAISNPDILFERYTDSTMGYNLAESFFMASLVTSWMQVVVGDPKTSIVTKVKASGNSPVCAGATLNLTASSISGATYSWTGPNGFSSTLQNPSIEKLTAAATGTYSVTTMVNGSSGPVATTKIAVNTCTGIEEIESTPYDVSAYPNPANKILYLKFDIQGAFIEAKITITDILGREVTEVEPRTINDGQVVPLNTSSLPTGMYFVKVTSNTITKVVKFIKQ